ncbi:hypothetical protein BSKO_06268 [Bryopsis sp. KO-2023]|nr:hypothetical protein BSKO_06268 [Bryopsis sp. KO-2023]
MRCLYEILGVDRAATDDEIKKAYRKQALACHPDKNQHRKEEAGEEFKAVQNAYEILSDKHERAWYDSHRDAILKSGHSHQAGGSGFESQEEPDDEIDIFIYFSSNCYNGHHDGPKGFFHVYSTVFDEIVEAEMRAYECRPENEDSTPPGPFPEFGDSEATSKSVFAFYSFWAGFMTVKPYAWKDQFNPASAPNRKVRRAMEDENKKMRKAARREFNNIVRQLAAFVKKRDKRVTKFQKEEADRKAAQKRAQEEMREKALEERRRKAQEYQDPNWVVEAEAESTSESEEEEIEEFWCVVCDKKFRSSKALVNHERSKKHRERLTELRQILEEEGDLNPDLLQEETQPQRRDDPPSTESSKKKSKKKKRKQKQDRAFQEKTETNDYLDESLEASFDRLEVEGDSGTDERTSMSKDACVDVTGDGNGDASQAAFDDGAWGSNAHAHANDPVGCLVASGEDEEEEEEEEADMDEDELLARLVSRQTIGGAKQSGRNQPHEDIDDDLHANGGGVSSAADDVAGIDDGGENNRSQGPSSRQAGISGDDDSSNATERVGSEEAARVSGGVDVDQGKEGEEEDWGTRGRQKKGRAKTKAKKETSKAQPRMDDSGVVDGGRVKGKAKKKRDKGKGKGAEEQSLVCKTCMEEFSSRNLLFKHMKDTNHTALKNV